MAQLKSCIMAYTREAKPHRNKQRICAWVYIYMYVYTHIHTLQNQPLLETASTEEIKQRQLSLTPTPFGGRTKSLAKLLGSRCLFSLEWQPRPSPSRYQEKAPLDTNRHRLCTLRASTPHCVCRFRADYMFCKGPSTNIESTLCFCISVPRTPKTCFLFFVVPS